MDNKMENNLDDDCLQEFEGAKLLINNDVKSKNCNEINDVTCNNNVIGNWNNWTNNFLTPISQLRDSFWCKREETAGENKEPSVNYGINVNNFFTYRLGTVEASINECEEQLLNAEIDGPLLDAFLLTEINIWDTEKERLVLITSKVLLIVKYDFIALKRLEFKKIQMDSIDSIIIGELMYPNKSLLQNRNTNGIRIMWNKGKPINFGTKWNPFSNNIPFVTLTSHPLAHCIDFANTNQQRLYNVEEFIQKMCEIIIKNKQNRTLNSNVCQIEHKEILLENYLSIGSMIHNKNALGYFKVRGKFSF